MFQQRPKTVEVYLHQTTFYHQDYQELQKTSISRINIKRYLHPVDFKKGPK